MQPDHNARAADDFFAHVNGEWIAKNPIPPEEARWGSFTVLRVEVDHELKAILDDLAAGKEMAPKDIAEKVRAFYATAMDVARANELGLKPLSDIFSEIDAIDGPEGMVKTVARLQRLGVGAWWIPYVAQDEKDTAVMAFHPFQGGLGLPDRDYYLKDDEKSRDIRAKYLAYMKAILVRIGAGEDAAETIMDIETRLAKASMTRVELRDPDAQYNKMSFEEVSRLTPAISWKKYFEAMAVPAPEYFITCQPEFMKAVDGLFGTLPPDAAKLYLRWCALNGTAPLLSEEMDRAHFDFYGRTFSGATEMKPRWRRVLAVLNGALDEAVGQLYVARHFSPEAKRRVNELVDRLTEAYRARLEALAWMGEETKKKALVKLASFSRKLGYPDKWKDYSALTIDGASYAENYMKVHAFEFDRQMGKIGKPVDRTEWYMSPQTVNACYQPPMNEILFPAAILQPPFFDENADDAANFGGIGSVIGHELTHGFDDEGSKFGPDGNLGNWWTAEDRKNFEEKAERLAAQFDAYEPLPGLHVNGHLTLGENIADLGGLIVAYDGLRIALGTDPAAATADKNGLTPAQRFFMSYAVTERGQAREEYVRMAVQTDPHSPGEFRVNGPASNLEPFYEAFGVKEGDGLWRPPEDRVKIW